MELITPEMIESFISESSDFLDKAEKNILEMERDPQNDKLIADSFRSVHTVKGNAGFFGYPRIEDTCMTIESTLDAIRRRTRKTDHDIVTSLLDSLDSLRGLINSLSKGTEEHPGSEKEVVSSPTGAEEERTKPSGKRANFLEMGMEELNGKPDPTEQSGIDSKGYKPLGDVLVEMGIVNRELVDKALDEQQKKLGEISLILDTAYLIKEKLY